MPETPTGYITRRFESCITRRRTRIELPTARQCKGSTQVTQRPKAKPEQKQCDKKDHSGDTKYDDKSRLKGGGDAQTYERGCASGIDCNLQGRRLDAGCSDFP